MFCGYIPSSASNHIYDFEINEIYYKIVSDADLEVKVTYKNVVTPENGDYQKSEVVIPESVIYEDKKYSVTSIGQYAFQACSNLISISIPNTVTSIEALAFESCTKLTHINFPSSLKSIGRGAFSNSGLINVVIPDSVINIEESAFEDCFNLTDIAIPNSIKSIGKHAFVGTAWWNKQPDGLVYLDNCLLGFQGNVAGDIEIDDGTILIGDDAFYNYSKLTNVTIPKSMKIIGDRAFSGCINLSKINIPDSVIKIDRSAFNNTAWWNEQPDGLVYLDNCLLGYKNFIAGEITIKENTRIIGGYAFNECSNITSVTIPNSVANVGECIFYFCFGLKHIISNAMVPPIAEENVFFGCDISNLVLKVPKGTSSIYQKAKGWTDLKRIEEFDLTNIKSIVIDNSPLKFYQSVENK